MKFIIGALIVLGDAITFVSAQHSWHKIMHETGSHRTSALAVYAAIFAVSLIVLGLLARTATAPAKPARPRYGNYTGSGR